MRRKERDGLPTSAHRMGDEKRKRRRKCVGASTSASRASILQDGSVRSFNNAMVLHAKRKQLSEASKIYDDLRLKKRANSHTYAIMINACVQCANIALAEQVFYQMKAAKMASVQSVTTLCRGYSSAGRIEAAQCLLNEAASLRPPVVLNVRSFNTFMRGCLWYGHVEKAVSTFRSMKSRFNVSPDASTAQYTISLLSSALRIREAVVASQQSGPPDAINLVAIARGAALAGNFAEFDRLARIAFKCIEKQLTTVPTVHSDPTQERRATGGKRAWKSSTSHRKRAAGIFERHPFAGNKI